MSQFVGYDATENDARVELDVLLFHSETDGIVVVDAGQIGTDRKTEDVRPQTMLGRRRKYPQHDVCRLKRWRTRFFRTGGGRRAFHPDYPHARSIENPACFALGCGQDRARDARGCTPERWGLAPRHRLISAKPKQDGACQAQSSVEVQGGRYAGAPRSLPCDQYLLPHVASSGGEGTLDLRSGYRHRAGGGPVSLGNRSTEIPGVNCPRFRACARTSASQSYGARYPTYHRGMLFHVHIPFSVFLVSIGKFSDLCHQTHFGL